MWFYASAIIKHPVSELDGSSENCVSDSSADADVQFFHIN